MDFEDMMDSILTRIDMEQDMTKNHVWHSQTGPIRVKDMGDGHLSAAEEMLKRQITVNLESTKALGERIAQEPLCAADELENLRRLTSELSQRENWIQIFRNERQSRSIRIIDYSARRINLLGEPNLVTYKTEMEDLASADDELF